MRILIRLTLAVGVLAFAGFALAQSYVTCNSPLFSVVTMTDGGSTTTQIDAGLLDGGVIDAGTGTVAGGAAGLIKVPAVNQSMRRRIQICNSRETSDAGLILKCAVNAPDGGLQLGATSPGHAIAIGECWPPSGIQLDYNSQVWCIGTMNNVVIAEVLECK